MQRQILTYLLREELGNDRLSRVFRAVDTRTQRPVVVRLLRVAGLVSPDRVEATRVELRRTLRAAASVAHPNLANVLDITSWRDLEIVAWDDFGGVPLTTRLAEAPAVEALRWAIETVSAIARAHSRQVPHGRISMANLIVARDDGVRVLDLGVPRPREVPFLVDRDEGGPLRPSGRDLPRVLRRDVEALAEVVREILGTATASHDAVLRTTLLDRAGPALAAAARPGATAATLHGALVALARATPATEGRARPATTSAQLIEIPEPDEPGRAPFSLQEYQLASTEDSGQAAPLRVWGGAAFEADVVEQDTEELEEPAAEPPVMSTVLLPPEPGDDDRDDDEPEDPARQRVLVALSVLLGIAIATGVFAIRNAGPAGPPADPSVSAPAPPATIPATPPAFLTGGPPPVAAAGLPAGTLVVAVSDSAVLVSLDGSRPEPAPVTWDRVPIGDRVIRVFRAGRLERVDTVTVRSALTTTRYYVLPPAEP